jgi:CHAT domain-containing protein/Tfp pilus assembly protein PilF
VLLAALRLALSTAATPPARAANGPAAAQDEATSAIRTLLDEARLGEAEALARKLLADRETRHGAGALETAEALDLLVDVLFRAGKAGSDEPKSLAERSLRIREAALGPNAVEVAKSLNALGIVLKSRGELSAARPLYERALAIRENAQGADHPDVARVLTNLGNLLRDTGDLAAARSAYERALRIREVALGPDHPDVGRTLDGLGNLLHDAGEYERARDCQERALAIAEASVGPDHPDVARVLNNLGILLHDAGEHAEARRLLERALSIRERALPPGHPYIAQSCMNLARLLKSVGDTASALPLLTRAAEIQENAHGPDHPDLALVLVNLANAHAAEGDSAAARALLSRAIAIQETALGPAHPVLAKTLASMGRLSADFGDRRGAEPWYERALAIREASLGADHPDVAKSLISIADIRYESGNLAGARTLLERAIAIEERALGPDHPDVAVPLTHLARVLARSGERERALDAALRAEAIGREHLRLTSRGLAEREALRYASVRHAGLDAALAIVSEEPRATARDRRRAWDALIRARAVVLDEMASRRHAAQADDPEIAELAAALRAARERLARLTVRGPRGAPIERYRGEIDAARRAKEDAERALADRSEAFRAETARAQIGFDDVVRALPPGSALVAFTRVERVHEAPLGSLAAPSAAGREVASPAEASYAAFLIVDAAAEPRLVPLGDAGTMEAFIAAWRRELQPDVVAANRPSAEIEADYRKAGGALRRALWDPLNPYVQGADRVFVVPDGALHLVSLAALPAGDDGYLVDGGPSFHYLSAERDIADLGLASAAGADLLALGDPDFDAGAVEGAGRPAPVGRVPPAAETPFRGERSSCGEFAAMRFSPLHAAGREIETIAALWRADAGRPEPAGVVGPGTGGRRPDDGPRGAPTALVLSGASANERAFKTNARGKRVVHLATHAFFLGDACAPTTVPPGGDSGRTSAALRTEDDPPLHVGDNPLLLSGFALAGANERGEAPAGEEDGILTAEEIAALHLEGTEWAVLSACNTGSGLIQPGEGVLGFRRAFQIAGVRTVIMSLWPVDDRAASEWMAALYEGRLLRKLTTLDAACAAARRILNERREKGISAHPYFWGGFVATGDWR